MIRTVLGNIEPDVVTGAYLHEHLIIDSSIVQNQMPHIFLDSVNDAILELLPCRDIGVNLFVDCMPGESGRNIEKLKEISRVAGVHIIAATGMHNPKYYESNSIFLKADRETFAQIFIEEITLDNCGIIKIHTCGQEPTSLERELFAGAVRAQELTGTPILTHCEEGMGALQQISLLNSLGADLSRVVLSHTDKHPNRTYHREILASGVNVEYDQSIRQLNISNKDSLSLTIEMCDAGYDSQIMLGTDGARRTLWNSLGGSPGLIALGRDWRTLLEKAELEPEVIDSLFRTNPQKFLSYDLKFS
jgi:phosphotriesterase-related protein